RACCRRSGSATGRRTPDRNRLAPRNVSQKCPPGTPCSLAVEQDVRIVWASPLSTPDDEGPPVETPRGGAAAPDPTPQASSQDDTPIPPSVTQHSSPVPPLPGTGAAEPRADASPLPASWPPAGPPPPTLPPHTPRPPASGDWIRGTAVGCEPSPGCLDARRAPAPKFPPAAPQPARGPAALPPVPAGADRGPRHSPVLCPRRVRRRLRRLGAALSSRPAPAAG